jgi:hypothetical protein
MQLSGLMNFNKLFLHVYYTSALLLDISCSAWQRYDTSHQNQLEFVKNNLFHIFLCLIMSPTSFRVLSSRFSLENWHWSVNLVSGFGVMRKMYMYIHHIHVQRQSYYSEIKLPWTVLRTIYTDTYLIIFTNTLCSPYLTGKQRWEKYRRMKNGEFDKHGFSE